MISENRTKEKEINNIIQEIESRKKGYVTALKARKYLLEFTASIPDEFFSKMDWMYASIATYSTTAYVNIGFLWDVALIRKVKQFLQSGGKNVTESDNDDKSRTILATAIKIENGCTIYVNAQFDVSVKGSKCVLVPLQTREVTKTVVDLYDRICPEGHPELFEEQDGELVYIGDSFAPAIKVEG